MIIHFLCLFLVDTCAVINSPYYQIDFLKYQVIFPCVFGFFNALSLPPPRLFKTNFIVIHVTFIVITSNYDNEVL